METQQKDHFKKILLEEQTNLEKELETVGRRNPDNPDDWEPTPSQKEDESDSNLTADNMEDFGDHVAILRELEGRWNSVKDALERIEDGTYGVCSVGGEAIVVERLEANPAATTCVEHAEEE